MKVSDGCKNCYAERRDNWFHHNQPHWGPNTSRKPQSDKYWNQPLKWNAEAEKEGVNALVFCASMADVFEDHPDTLPHLLRLFELIRSTPSLTWQLLTKRPENIQKLIVISFGLAQTHQLRSWFAEWLGIDGKAPKPPENVWLGTSVENDKVYERVEHLVQVPAAIRFLSCEPLLGPIDIPLDYADGSSLIDWVICGGESGVNARHMHPDWARSLRDQTQASNAAFFFKQWGEIVPESQITDSNRAAAISWAQRFQTFHNSGLPTSEDGERFFKIGKKNAGRLLDGKEHNEFPETKQKTERA